MGHSQQPARKVFQSMEHPEQSCVVVTPHASPKDPSSIGIVLLGTRAPIPKKNRWKNKSHNDVQKEGLRQNWHETSGSRPPGTWQHHSTLRNRQLGDLLGTSAGPVGRTDPVGGCSLTFVHILYSMTPGATKVFPKCNLGMSPKNRSALSSLF